MRRSWNDTQTQNLEGKKFSRLLVICATKSRHNRSRWICLCDCGTECVADGKALRSGKKQSCGCIRRELAKARAAINSENNKLPVGESAFNLLYATYRCEATRRKLSFELSKEDFRELTSEPCNYCGIGPNHKITSVTGSYLYNGIDRVKNDGGYVRSNCAACCGTCNWMKRTQTVEDFIKACEAVVNHQKELRLGEPRRMETA